MYYGNCDNIIVTDVDGVLLNWVQSYDVWMAKRGYEFQEEHRYKYDMALRYNVSKEEAWRSIRTFNESAAIRNLAPFRDAVKYVRKLHDEHGYVFHIITSLTTDEDACQLRIENLENIFGKHIFKRYSFCDVGACKKDKLKEYEGSELFWIEDHYENAVAGEEIGLRPLLVDHYFNADVKTDIPRVYNWKDIYDIITGE